MKVATQLIITQALDVSSYWEIEYAKHTSLEEAFANSDRVMTVSIHKYGPKGGDMFFPGTGDVVDVGTDKGKFYSVNFPLKEGMISMTAWLCRYLICSRTT